MITEETYRVGTHASTAPLASSNSPDYAGLFQQYASEFASDASKILLTIDSTILTITKLAFVTLLLLGFFLYYTRIARRLGRDLIYGGVALAILSEFVFPLLNIS